MPESAQEIFWAGSRVGKRSSRARFRNVHLSWVPLPNTLDGDGYTALMERKNGAALYGAWVALVLVATTELKLIRTISWFPDAKLALGERIKPITRARRY